MMEGRSKGAMADDFMEPSSGEVTADRRRGETKIPAVGEEKVDTKDGEVVKDICLQSG